MPQRTLVVDNGSYTIKAGFAKASSSYDDCHIIPNCIVRSRDRRVLVGTQLESCRDYGGMAFRRPVEKVRSSSFWGGLKNALMEIGVSGELGGREGDLGQNVSGEGFASACTPRRLPVSGEKQWLTLRCSV
jgi:hypothetical protein